MTDARLQSIARTIAQIRAALPQADATAQTELLAQLTSLRALATSILDAWLEVDEAIEDTLAEYAGEAEDTADESVQQVAATSLPHDNQRIPQLMEGPVSVAETWFDLSLQAECLLRKGLAYYDLCMYDQASAALSYVAEQTDEPAVRIYLALSHLAAGRLSQAASELNEARQAARDELTMQAVIEVDIQLAAARGDWHGAIHALYTHLGIVTDQPDTWYNLGVCHLHLSEFAAAERCFARAAMANPPDIEAVLWRAFALCLTGRPDVARQLLANIALRPAAAKQPQLLIVLAQLTGDSQLAEEVARAYRHHHPYEATGELLLALCHALSNRFEQAVTHCKRALFLAPNDPQAMAFFGFCSYLTGAHTQAANAFEQAVMNGCEAPFIPLLKARLCALGGESEAAVAQFAQLVEHPRLAVRRLALLYRGMLYANVGDAELAKADFARAAHLGVPQPYLDTILQTIF